MIIKLKENKYPEKSKADYIISYKEKAGDIAQTIGTATVNGYGDIDVSFNEGWEPKPPESRIRKVIRKM